MVDPLTSDAIAAWQARTNAALADLTAGFEDRFGYPPGVNAVHPATPATRAAAEALGPLPADLAALYREIAAADLPDVDHGFFVHPPDLVAAHGPHPLVFASDGGGLLFALTTDGRVLRSLAASRDAGFALEAGCLRDFLDQLAGRAEALGQSHQRTVISPRRAAPT
ncbi:hypothetical protein ACFYS8_35565 [Kitasatospora sp. NPDC004615]|uniref:hypothetical protein n=1 Tax=Kitasatospora sp. NPDC004615 TaxID=3364017 RepID=UPI0036A56A10